MSYSAYLWHQPLFAFGKHANLGEPTIIFSSILVITTFILAFFTWSYVEIPCRNRIGFKRKSLILLVTIFTTIQLGQTFTIIELQPIVSYKMLLVMISNII